MAGKTVLTKQQELAVKSKGMVLVSASAGSGKTHTMLERIMHLIEEGVGLNRMLILVYNEANASELREKIRQKLFEKVCENVGETADKYCKQLDEIAFSTICTIHAFCRSIIRTNFEVLGINPDFDILDETTHNVYMSKAMDQVFDEYSKAGDEVFHEMLSIFEVTRSEDNLRSNVQKLFECMDVQSDLEGFLTTIRSYYDSPDKFDNVIFEKFEEDLTKVNQTIEKIMPSLVATGQKTYVAKMQDVETYLGILKARDINAIHEVLFAPSKQARKTATAILSDIETAKKCAAKAKDIFATIDGLYYDTVEKNRIFEQNKKFAFKLIELTLRFKEVLDQMKKEDSVMSFSDLEHGAVKLIDAGIDLAENYDHVFVDEYQDVNGAQEYVISHLIKDNAFMVGDVKQSIYGFRLADPDIFLARQQSYLEGARSGDDNRCHPIFFNDNFRSDNQILQFVNGIFDYAMTKKSADIDYASDARFSTVTDPDRNEGRVEVHVFQHSLGMAVVGKTLYKLSEHEDCSQVESELEAEGRYIAEEIKKIKSKTLLTIKGERRPLQYGDFALLFIKRSKSANIIIDQLKEAGIPVDDGSFTDEEVPVETELVNMLLVIDNPRQDYALAGFMLSYLGGYTEDEMAKIVDVSKEGNLYDRVLKYSTLDDSIAEKIRATLSTLDKYRVKSSVENVKALVEDIVLDTCYDAYLYSNSQSSGNAFQAYLDTIPEDSTSLSRYLREYKNNSAEVKKSSVGGDRVHVSTYHKYKGLETPVVFLPNAADKKNMGATKDLNVDAKGCIAMSYYNTSERTKRSSTISNRAIGIMMREREYKEAMRVYYVALTRAQKYMYITGSCSLDDDSFDVENVEEAFSVSSFEKERSLFNFVFTAKRKGTLKCSVFLHQRSQRIYQYEKSKPFFAMGGKKTAFDEELEKEIEKARGYVYPHQEETTLAMKYTVTALNADSVKDLGVSFPVHDESDNDRRNDGVEITAIGTAYHRVMELIDFSLDDLGAVTKAIDQMVADGLLREEQRALVKDDEILKALMNPVIKSAAGEKCYHEQPFMMYVPARDVIDGSESDDKVLVQGVIDLLVRGKENVIIDFKYSAFRTEESKEKYKKQLYLYKMAYERAFREKIDKVVLLSLKTGESFQL